MDAKYTSIALRQLLDVWIEVLLYLDEEQAIRSCAVLSYHLSLSKGSNTYHLLWRRLLARDFCLGDFEDLTELGIASTSDVQEPWRLYHALSELRRRTAWFPGPYGLARGRLLGWASLGNEFRISYDLTVHERQGDRFGCVVVFGSSMSEPVPAFWLSPRSSRVMVNDRWACQSVFDELLASPELPLGQRRRLAVQVCGDCATFALDFPRQLKFQGKVSMQDEDWVPIYAGSTTFPSKCELANVLLMPPHRLGPLLEISLRRLSQVTRNRGSCPGDAAPASPPQSESSSATFWEEASGGESEAFTEDIPVTFEGEEEEFSEEQATSEDELFEAPVLESWAITL
mmetsp:Transcript_144557/g.266625  ORF Transcript_144557/g.266625 Transcript_144557/m.266625 type:complete len:343 (-) Transcript_144557:12-1040(-)